MRRLDEAAYDELNDALGRLPPLGVEFALGAFASWDAIVEYSTATIDGVLCIFAKIDGSHVLWGPPLVPPNDPRFVQVLTRALEIVEELNGGLGFANFIPDAWHAVLPESDFFMRPLHSEYLYSRLDLAELQGHRFKRIRNEIRHFMSTYAWRVERIGPESRAGCEAILDLWASSRQPADPAEARTRQLYVQAERRLLEIACEGTMRDLVGLAVFVEDRIVAFTLAQATGHPSHREAAIIVEKTDHRISGLGRFIFWQAAKELLADFDIINKGGDMDLPGLRQAKIAYSPQRLRGLFAIARRPNA